MLKLGSDKLMIPMHKAAALAIALPDVFWIFPGSGPNRDRYNRRQLTPRSINDSLVNAKNTCFDKLYDEDKKQSNKSTLKFSGKASYPIVLMRGA